MFLTLGEQSEAIDMPESEKRILRGFESIFAERESLPPERPGIDHTIILKDSTVQPCVRAPYKIPQKFIEEMRNQIMTMVNNGRIVLSTSSWASPCMFVPKKDTSVPRLVCDYRYLNGQTVKPALDDAIQMLAGAQWLSTLDLKAGYHQVKMAPQAQALTAFATPWGLYEWTVMPNGLSNAPSTFMTLMNGTFSDLIGKCVFVYLDDVLIYSPTLEQHRLDLMQVFDRLQRQQLVIHRRKSHFFKRRIEYIGHVVEEGGIRPLQGKVDALSALQYPTSPREVQRILGIINYYRKFIRDFAGIAKPLYDLTHGLKRPNDSVSQAAAAAKALERLKASLKGAPKLHFPVADHNELVMHTDASLVTVGAVLQQQTAAGLCPLEFFSQALSPVQQRYATHERELLAIVLACRHWRHILIGRHIMVHSDHKPSTYLLKQPHLSDRQVRWLMTLADFNLDIQYVKGAQNIVADLLSRPRGCETTPNNVCNAVEEVDLRRSGEETEIRELGHEEPAQTAPTIEEQLVTAWQGRKEEAGKCGEVEWIQGLPVTSDGSIEVPNEPALLKGIIADSHDSAIAGHLGLDKTAGRIRALFTWRGMMPDVISYCQSCTTCQRAKKRSHKPNGLLNPLNNPSLPWTFVGVDFLELPRDAVTGNNYFDGSCG